MGSLEDLVRVVKLDEIEPISLAGGSWSRMVLTKNQIPEIRNSLGYSVFRPGTETSQVSHEVEEYAFVVQGKGELRLENGHVSFGQNDALFIPAQVWHSVANTGHEDVIMVFGFAYPDYPPSERR